MNEWLKRYWDWPFEEMHSVEVPCGLRGFHRHHQLRVLHQGSEHVNGSLGPPLGKLDGNKYNKLYRFHLYSGTHTFEAAVSNFI